MKKVVTCSQMKLLDSYTIRELHVPSLVLMEKASMETVKEMKTFFRKKKIDLKQQRILVVCGSGNNGGDGIAIARLLHLERKNVQIYLAGNADKMTEETRHQWEIAMAYQVPVTNNPVWNEYTVIVDAIFGVGLSRSVTGNYAALIDHINETKAYKIAVDIPSGISGDLGCILGRACRADLTVTFAYRKRGLCLYPGRMYAGKVKVADIGIYSYGRDHNELVPKAARHIDERDIKKIPKRASDGNKGTFGKVLFVAGSAGMSGAAFLSASAALHGGAGMVKIQTVEENRLPLQMLLPEAIVTCEFDEESNEKNLDWCDVLVIGPGLGTDGLSKERMLWYLENGARKGKPVILDADGLNLLACHPGWMEFINEKTILTPHMGEMSRLTGKEISELKKDPAAAAFSLSEKSKAVCVLKDACTVVSGADEILYFNLSGNSGMATAGSGDVLSGMIAAVVCMYLSDDSTESLSYQAALAVYLHGRCGDQAAKEKGTHGMTAADLITAFPKILKRSEKATEIE